MNGLTHIDPNGNAYMVDVGEKVVTVRTATASGRIKVGAKTFAVICEGTAKKGDVLGVAQIAGIMAVKRTADLIPLCHPLPLTKCAVQFKMIAETFEIEATCTAGLTGKTGVEMEALTGVSVALLTIYDMCKAIDRSMEIGQIRLLHKDGGKSGRFVHPDLQEGGAGDA